MATEKLSDAELARKCRQNNAKAWRQLVRRVSPLVYRLAVRMLGQGSDADDACQEVFMRIHRSFNTYDPTRPLAPWVARITYNVCLRKLGKVSDKLTSPTDPQEFQLADSLSPSPEEQLAGKETAELVWDTLEQLPVQDRALMSLRYQEGMSEAEVSEATGMPVNTVKTRLHRARGKMKKKLQRILRGGA